MYDANITLYICCTISIFNLHFVMILYINQCIKTIHSTIYCISMVQLREVRVALKKVGSELANIERMVHVEEYLDICSEVAPSQLGNIAIYLYLPT